MLLLSTEIYIITFFITVVLSIFVLFNNRKSNVNRFFFLLGFSIGLWVLSNVIINLTYNQFFSLFFARISIIWVALLPIFFNQFIKHLYFTEDHKYQKLNKVFLRISYVITLIIILLSQTSLNIRNIILGSWGVDYQPGELYFLLLFYMILVFGFSFRHLLKIAYNSNDPKNFQAKSILVGACTTVILSIFTNIIFPFMGYGFLAILGPITVLIFLIFIAYSITKHHLFNIRIITIELVTFSLWITILIRTLLANTRQEMFIESGLLVITVIFGIMLIRGTLHEIQQRQRIEKLAEDLRKAYGSLKDLNDNLEQKVAEQTHKIRRAYEVEKEARVQLQKLNETKNELITAAQHNLRTPLTALKWQLEVIRKNNSGTGHSLEEALKESEASVERLTSTIEDFLNITALSVHDKKQK